MENFFVRYSEDVSFSTEDHLYDNRACIEGGVLRADGVSVQLPFRSMHLRNLPYDFLVVSEDRLIYRINKYRREIEEVGRVHDRILGVHARGDSILVVTEREIMLFNAYFDLVRSRDLHRVSVEGARACEEGGCRLAWADDAFCLITACGSVVYSMALEIVSVMDEKITDAVFMGRYNKFACAVGGVVKFIEPNGLEHGDQLPVFCDVLSLLCVDGVQMLVAGRGDRTELYCMRNFCWDKKMEVAGRFVCCEGNAVVVGREKGLVRHYVYGETNEGLVIDGRRLRYTDFSKAIIPPPYCHSELELGHGIDALHREDGVLHVLSGGSVHRYSMQDCGLLGEGETLVGTCVGTAAACDVVAVGKHLVVRAGNVIHRVENGRASRIDHLQTGPVLRLYSICGCLGVLFTSGELVLFTAECTPRCVFKFRISLSCSFDLQWRAEEAAHRGTDTCGLSERMGDVRVCSRKELVLYLLSDGALQVARQEGTGCHVDSTPYTEACVRSFLCFGAYVVYIAKDKLVVSENGSVLSTSYADAGLALLAIKDNRIICQTRFGTLETTTNKIFSRRLVQEHVRNRRHREAAGLCDKHHIGYDAFYSNRRCPVSVIDQLENSHVLSLVGVLGIAGPVYHENDTLQRLRAVFTPDMVFAAETASGAHGLCILESCSAHLFADPYHKRLLDTGLLAPPACAGDADCIDLDDQFLSLNTVLRRLDPRRHLSAVVGLFIALKRVDLCFYLPDLERVVRLLFSRVPANEILKAAMLSLSLEKIVLAHKVCQADHTPFVSFYRTRENTPFSVHDYLEDRRTALYHLVRDAEDAADGRVREYVEKHGLFDELLMHQYFGLTKHNFYCYVARHADPEKAFALFLLGGDRQEALAVAKRNLLWRQALCRFDGEDVALCFVQLLLDGDRLAEAAEVYERHLGDHRSAIRLYIRSNRFGEAFSIYKAGGHGDMSGLFVESSRTALKNEIAELGAVVLSYEKYRDRIHEVRRRLNESTAMSQTSFSYTSSKSIRNALTKDRPGGAYEHEYVLNKICGLVGQIVAWRERTEALLRVFGEFGMEECAAAHDRTFADIKRRLRGEVGEMWAFERPDYDPNRPVIDRPAIPSSFE